VRASGCAGDGSTVQLFNNQGLAAAANPHHVPVMDAQQNTTRLPTACLPDASAKPVKRRRLDKKRTRPQLLTRDQLDGRTNAARFFDRLVADIESDLGGADQLSTIERSLIEGFAGAAVTLQHLNTQLALGQEIDLSQHAQAVSAMVRVASRLGLQRRQRDVGLLDPLEYAREHLSP
jgi:hypothetical protein